MDGQKAIASLRDAGRPLPRRVRSTLEPRFGRDFSAVRIHTGADATEATRAVNALAFTYGRHIAFTNGAYSSESEDGRRLLAHELTHVVQQGEAPTKAFDSSDQGSLSADTDAAPPRPSKAIGARPATLQTERSEERVDRGADPRASTGPPPSTTMAVTNSLSHSLRRTCTECRSHRRAGTRPYHRLALQADGRWGGTEIRVGSATVQSPDIQRYPGESYVDEIGEWAGEQTEAAGEWIDETTEPVREWVSETGEEVGEWAIGQLQDLAASFGGELSVTDEGVRLTIPPMQVCDPFSFSVPLTVFDEISLEAPVEFDATLGDFAATFAGSLGLDATLSPQLFYELGPCRTEATQLEVDLGDRTLEARGGLSIDSTLSVSNSSDVGVSGAVSADVHVPGDPPFSMNLSPVELAAGLTGYGIGSVSQTLNVIGDMKIGAGSLRISSRASLTPSLSITHGLAGYGNLKCAGEQLCRLYFPLFTSELGVDVSLGIGGAFEVDSSGFEGGFSWRDPKVDGSADIDLLWDVVDNVFVDECPLCNRLSALGILPGGVETHPEYRPKTWDAGPLEKVHERAPYDDDKESIVCRGACGPNCWSCDSIGEITVRASDGRTWVYENYEECPTHVGCRDHDACYDLAEDKGESGIVGFSGLTIDPHPIHRLCDLECICNYSTSECAAWIGGANASETMHFSDKPRIAVKGGQAESETVPGAEDGPQLDEPNPAAELEKKTAEKEECAKPTDLAPGVRIFLPDRKEYARVDRVVHIAERGLTHEGPNVWYIQYRIVKGGTPAWDKEFRWAHDTKCNPTYTIPTLHQDCRTSYDRQDTPVRTGNRNYTGPPKKAEWVKAYPLCPTTYLPPREDPAGYARLRGWDRAHLINGQLNGPGAWWNLFPATSQINQQMKNDYEEDLRKKVAYGLTNGEYYWFEAKVSYHDDSENDHIGYYDDFPKLVEVRYGKLEKEENGWNFLPADKLYPFKMDDRPDIQDMKPWRLNG